MNFLDKILGSKTEEEDKIIWSGITESFNPDGVVNMTSDISKLIYKKMLAEGFVVKR
mgnify:CR=1 FL=1